MKKKITLLVFAVLATLNIHAYDFKANGLYFNILSKTELTCEVTRKDQNASNCYSGDVVVPEKVTYNGTVYTVTGIGSYAFTGCDRLSSVILPKTIETIGTLAFNRCILLQDINIPLNVTTIGFGAFMDCTKLESADFGKCNKIENSTFEGCESLSSVIIPLSVISIGSSAFEGCVNLTNVDLGQCQQIGANLFSGCKSLKEIIIPSSVTSIGSSAFSGCISLANITLKDSENPIKMDCDFKDCFLDSVYVGRNVTNGISYRGSFANETLRSAYISDYVTVLNEGLFKGCSALKNVYGMENVEEIKNYSFQECTSLKKFVIKDNVKKIGTGILSKCTALDTLVIGDGIETISSDFVFAKVVYLGKNIKTMNKNAISEKVQRIYLFSDVLTSVYYSEVNTGYVTIIYRAIPLTVEAIYVVNPERYKTLLGDYNLRPLMAFNETSVEYTGKTPELSYRNNVEGMEASFSNETTPKDVGNYNTNLDVTFANDDWATTIQIPCSYSITKAPLSIIVNGAQREYGEENPELSCTYMGFKNGETEDVLDVLPTLYTTATKESNVGTYSIYASNAEAKNYDIRYERGNLIVNKASQTISWEQDLSNAKVGDMIELTATTSAGLPVKYRSSDTSVAYILTQSGKQYAYILKEGLVILTAYQSGDANHEEAEEENKILNITSTGIDGVYTDLNTSCTYYTIDGRQITEPSKSGVTIVKMNDGTIRKITSK